MPSVAPKEVGCIGFCMGGSMTLMLAAANPAVAAAAPFYGLIPWEAAQPDFSKLEAKVRGHYAAEDGFFSPEMARALEQQLRDLGKDAVLEVHEGVDHAFFNDTRPEVHDPEESADAWNTTIAFFREHVK
jgi:carboxymethylenebutenolidase